MRQPALGSLVWIEEDLKSKDSVKKETLMRNHLKI